MKTPDTSAKPAIHCVNPAVPNVLLSWLAFVLARPLGAAGGDALTKPVGKGGPD